MLVRAKLGKQTPRIFQRGTQDLGHVRTLQNTIPEI